MSSRKRPPNKARFVVPTLAIFLAIMIGYPALPVSSSIANGGFSAEPMWIFDSDLDVAHVETADLNGDGIEDVIAAEYSSTYYGYISFVFGIDGETGLELWSYQVNDGIRSMTIGDLNNDDVMDVIAGASYNSGETPDGRIHAIDGTDGSQLWTYDVGATISAVTTGNFNGDPYLDVAAGSFDDYVYAVNGETGAELWKRYIGSLWINAVDAGDVDGDGIDDVGFAHEYLAGWDNYLGVLDGDDGSPIWELTVSYVVFDVLIEDIDDDDELEAVFGGCFSDDHGEVFVRDGSDGTLEWSYNLGAVNHSNGDILLYSYDLDEDTDPELVVGTYLGTQQILTFEGDSDTPLWISETLDGNTRDITFGDVTDDKDIDIVAATSDRVQAINGVDGTKVWYYSVAGSMYSVACADFDHDEIWEVAAGGGADHSGSNPGKTVWALKTVISPILWEFNFGEYGNELAVADLNDDGYDDAVGVSSVDDLAIAINGQTGAELWRWNDTENLYAVTAGDFDNNGLPDVAVGGNAERVTALRGTDGQIMWQFDEPTDQIYRKCLAATDLNGDGDVDVIAGTDDNNVYARNGADGSEIWTTDVAVEVNDVKLAQMNDTGPLDVIVGGGGTVDRLSVIDGSNGSILWGYIAPESVEHVAITDANDDGVFDVAAAITPFGTRQIIVVDGLTHTELWTQPVEVASNVHSMASGDLDWDKIPDIVVPGSSGDMKVHALSGADGHELWSYETGGEVNCVMIYDVDLDDQPDVIAGSDDQNVYVINGLTGEMFWSYSCADDVMDVRVGDISGDGLPNIACITFGSDGIVYAFKSLATAPSYICGDANGDETINLLDITFIIDYLYRDGPPPDPEESADADGSGGLNLLDATYLINYLYRDGPDPICEG